jgi:ribosome-associated protein
MAKTPKKTSKSVRDDKPARKKRSVRSKDVAEAPSVPGAPKTRRSSSKPSGSRKLSVAAPQPEAAELPSGVDSHDESLQNAMIAVEAARSKLAKNMLLLDLRGMADFTDFFFICSGTNPRQVQAICDEIDTTMKKAGLRTAHTEGYNHAEWVLLDYVDFVAHIFTEQARDYYDLERLWRTADRVPLDDESR